MIERLDNTQESKVNIQKFSDEFWKQQVKTGQLGEENRKVCLRKFEGKNNTHHHKTCYYNRQGGGNDRAFGKRNSKFWRSYILGVTISSVSLRIFLKKT